MTDGYTEITTRARAFEGEQVRMHRMLTDGATVLVWDDVAGYFTSCHSLCASALRRIRRAAP